MNAEGEITTQEAAERLGVSRRTITRQVRSGNLAARRVSATGRSGIFLIPVGELEAFEVKRSAPPEPKLPSELLERVAAFYVEAVEDGEPPRPFIAERFGKSINTIDGWISAARKRGFLDPAR